jgi:hypothetical protein
MTEGKQVSVNLYNQVVSTNFTVYSCQRVTETQEFTETWTFSRIISLKSTTVEAGLESECRKAVKDNCKSHPCHSHGPNIIADFRYAQTVTKSASYLRIQSLNISGFKSSKDYKGSILLEGKKVDISAGTAIKGSTRYIWEDANVGDSCIWEAPLASLLCYEHEEYAVCPKMGLYLSQIRTIQTLCKHQMFMDKTGIVFSVGNNPPNDYYPAVIQTLEIGLRTAIEATRYAFMIRDQHKCQQDCLNIGKVAVMVGSKYYVKQEQQWLECMIVPNCTITKSTYICDEGEIISTTCSGAFVRASLKSPFQLSTPHCSSNQSKGYNRDEVMAFLTKYHSSHNEFNILRSEEIKEVQLYGDETTLSGKAYKDNGTESTSTSISWVSSVVSSVKKIKDWITEISHNMKVIALCILLAVIIFAVVSITIKVERRRHGSPIKVIYTPIVKDIGHEETIIK